MPTDYKREAWLYEKYHEEGLTQAEMAEICGVSPRTIREWMNRHGVETRDLKGEDHPLYGRERDEGDKRRISKTLENREFSDEAKRQMSQSHLGKELPDSVTEKISDALSDRPKPAETRAKMSESRRGTDNPNWKGGNSEHYGPGWTAAKRAVFQCDGACQNCGITADAGEMEVHHVIPVREFANCSTTDLEDAHVLENLVLLCHDCHCEVHYGSLEFETEIPQPEDR